MSHKAAAAATPSLLLAFVVLAHTAVAETASKDKSEFRVDSAEREDYLGTTEEVQSNVTDALAAKLRQFDEWTVDAEAASAARAAESDGGPEGGAGTAGESPSGGSGSADSTGQASRPPSSQAAGAAAAAGSPEPSSLSPASNAPAAVTPVSPTQSATSRPPPEDSASPPQPARADRPSREDDVARMIREAAEQETDPDRKRALMEQYDAYIENQQ